MRNSKKIIFLCTFSSGFIIQAIKSFQISTRSLNVIKYQNSIVHASQHYDIDNDSENKKLPIFTRREIACKSLQFLSAVSFLSINPQKSSAACLYGDISPSCIGIYKVPMDEAISSYVSTPEQLAKFAPEMNFVPPIEEPKSYKQALDDIHSCEPDMLQNLQTSVLNGNLEEAGVLVLKTIPKLTMAGRFVVNYLTKVSDTQLNRDPKNNVMSMKCYRVESAMTALLSSLGVLDIYLGQGLRGQMGVITAAQLAILPDVKDVVQDYKELKQALPAETDAVFIGKV